MTLIRVKGEAAYDEMISMEYLHRLVLKSIFDEDHMSRAEYHLMEDSFERWYEYLNETVIESAVGHEQRISLELYALQIKMNQEGKYEKRKETFKAHGIDYLKFYKMPNSITAEDLKRGQAIMKDWTIENAGNPELN